MLSTDDMVPAIGDPDRITILQLAETSQPISLPWFAKTVIPGTTFHSRLSNTGDPFGHTTPFKTESLQKSPLVYRIEDGAESTFYSAETKTKLTSRDHMSLSLGVSAGCSFLNASATGGYDKDVRENRDGYKKSIKTRCRYGSIMFETAPKLNDSAKVILKHQGGIEAFKRHYGDYYVSGYRIGGEAGLLLSVAACAKDVTDTYSFTLAAQAFIFKVSKTYRKFFSEASASSTMTLSGYDTLGSRQITLKGSGTGGGGDIMKLMETASVYENLGQNLDFRIEERMREFRLEPDDTIGLEICDAICKSGVVVELLLSPMVTLREVMLWGKNDNII